MRLAIGRLLTLVLVLTGLAACTDSQMCPVPGAKQVELATPLEPADLSLQFAIESCRIDADDCTALCTQAVEPLEPGAGAPTCEIVFHADHITVTASYLIFIGDNCPVFAPNAPERASGAGPRDLAARIHPSRG
jgi:hypothetical protein